MAPVLGLRRLTLRTVVGSEMAVAAATSSSAALASSSSSCSSSWSSSLRPRSADRPNCWRLNFGDQQLAIGDHRLGAGGAGLRLLARRTLGQQGGLQRVNGGGQGFGRRHKPNYLILFQSTFNQR